MGRPTLTISALVLCLSAASAFAVNPPPRPLHKVGDHWTPYEPPSDFPAEAQVYTIKAGDTLWDLAKQFLGDPYLWPQIWEQNQYIKDAHWIYPGDPLVVKLKAAEAPAEPTPTPQPEATPEPAATPQAGAAEEAPAGNFVVIGSEDDVYCFGYLDDPAAAPQFQVASGEASTYQDTFASGDIVYVTGGEADGIKAGDEFFAVKPGELVHHPATGAILGRMMRYVGHLRILCTQEHSATAEVLNSCDQVEPGDWLKPFEAIPIPMVNVTPVTDRCTLPNDKPKGFIVYSKDGIYTIGQDHMVLLDLGAADQLAPGTLCTVYRDNSAEGMPRIVLGQLAVLTTGEHWATAKIIDSRYPMSVGDKVEVK